MTRFRDYRSVAPATAAKEFQLEERKTQAERRPFRFSHAAPAPPRSTRARASLRVAHNYFGSRSSLLPPLFVVLAHPSRLTQQAEEVSVIILRYILPRLLAVLTILRCHVTTHLFRAHSRTLRHKDEVS